MFLLERIDFLALLGLLLQAGLTWIFLSIFLVLWRGSQRPEYFRTWTLAFAALALGLTAVSARFFCSFDGRSMPAPEWAEGEPLPRLAYSIYLAGKALFALLLLRGAEQLAGVPGSRGFARLAPVVVLVLALAPAFDGRIHDLLLLQVPLMVLCPLLAWRRLAHPRQGATVGIRMVRFTLAGIALTWCVHGLSIAWSFVGPSPLWDTLRALNSYLDMALELPLGAGLIVIQFEDARHRLRAAQAAQARLRLQAERDERLRALGTIVSGVAHELNNPLTAILGFSEELVEGRDPGYAGQVIHEQAERCRGIVRSLSALAVGHAHRSEPQDARGMVERVARGFGPQLASSGVALELQLSPVGPVLADAFEIEQVLTNLVSNAIHATPRGRRVCLRLAAESGRTIFEVEDEGPGIPEEARERIFEPFFSTKPSGSGTGLGLSVAFAIVRAHGGQLSVGPAGSTGGACFRFDLPSVPGAALPAGSAPEDGERASGRHLLLVEDDAAVRSIVGRRAQRHGWRVEDVASAEAALEILVRAPRAAAQVPPDVVLCDLRMPGMGGQGLFRALAAWPELQQRCLFFSGDLASAEALAFARESPHPLIGKPLDFGKLFAELERVAAAAAAHASPRTG